MSMDSKEPSLTDNDIKIQKKAINPRAAVRFQYGEHSQAFLSQKRFRNSIFMRMNSSSGIAISMHVAFAKKLVRRADRAVGGPSASNLRQ